MRNKVILFLMIILVSLGLLNINTYAASMENFKIELDKTTIHPEENVNVKLDFGQFVGSYTFNFEYDNKLLEFVSASDGTSNNTGDKVIVVYHYDNNGTPAEELNVVFRAKAGIVTSNPTEINITASGLANADASERYDDITTPITKQLVVEPIYEDYAINLNYTGEILANTPKQMTASITSRLGKPYEHVRLIAEATAPEDANVKLIGIDENNLEQDITQSGWGADAGYSIGGINVNQTLNLTGTFTKKGAYTIKFKLVDRDDSDHVIAEKSIDFNVVEAVAPTQTPSPTQAPSVTPTPTQVPSPTKIENPTQTPTKEEKPKEIPKAGFNVYIIALGAIGALVLAYIGIARKK